MTNHNPALLLLVALALLLLGLGLWLFDQARRKDQARSVQSYLQRSLQAGPAMASGGLTGAGGAASRAATAPNAPTGQGMAPAALGARTEETWQTWLENKLGLAAWGVSAPVAVAIAVAGLLLFTAVALAAGALAALLLVAIYALLVGFVVWRRSSKRRQRLLQQLPRFLDNMVRLISIGNSPYAAFQIAAKEVESPLGDALREATALLGANPDLGHAMQQLEHRWGVTEFGLLAAVFRMSVRYGGRADLVLDRVAAYIRDRQSAEQELHALSAEIRLSAWVLALLPIGVGALIMVLNAGYFLRMWNDPAGQQMILLAAGLEAVGAFWLYRLARLK